MISTFLRVFVLSRETMVSILMCPPSLRSHAAPRKVNHNRAYSVNWSVQIGGRKPKYRTTAAQETVNVITTMIMPAMYVRNSMI